MVIEGGDERKNRRPRVGRERHVADVDFVEGRFADAEHERSEFFQRNVGRAFYEMRGDAVGDAAERADAAGDDDHGVGRIRPAGHVGADIGVFLLLNFRRGRADELTYEVGASGEAEFLRHNAERAVGGDEVHGLDAAVTLDGEQEVLQE